MSRGKKPDSALTPEEFKARSIAQWTKYIEEVDQSEEFGIGQWVKPKGFEDYHFVMFDRTIGFHKETAAAMMRQGYAEAPKGTRLIGAEDQGERVLYLCAPKVTYEARKARKQQAMLARAQTINQDFGGQLAGIERLGSNTKVEVTKREITG